jgi:arachidonate 15-lipoxygenase
LFEVLADIPRGTWQGRPKYLPVSVGLFAWQSTGHADRGELLPVAIAVLDHDDHWRTVTPFTNNILGAGPAQVASAWSLAKLWLQVADANVHEMWSHLYGAHFAMEPVAVATGRWLRDEHPINQLLRPHLRILLFNNDIGKKLLVNPGGRVDTLLAASLKGSLEVVRRAAAAYDFTTSSFREDLKARGVDDNFRLPHYPFRDDGLLLLVINTVASGIFAGYLRRVSRALKNKKGSATLASGASAMTALHGKPAAPTKPARKTDNISKTCYSGRTT